LLDGCVKAELKLMMRAPASIQSVTAPASSSGVALGICAFADISSANMGRTNRVQFGQIAGARELRLAQRIPATKVPCIQAALPAEEQALESFPGISRIFSLASSGWFMATGPSINPMVISDLPEDDSISGVSFTNSKGPVVFTPLLLILIGICFSLRTESAATRCSPSGHYLPTDGLPGRKLVP